MLKRIISGACYVAIVVGFFLLRVYVSYLAFDLLLCFFCAMGSFEMARALKRFTTPCGFWVSTISGILLPLFFALSEFFWQLKFAGILTGVLLACIILGLLIVKFIIKMSYKAFGITVFTLFYPLVGVLAMMVVNTYYGMFGLTGLLLIFSIPALSDSLAYFIGVTVSKIKKGRVKKLCPSISPNKTWAGAIGAVIGGAVAGLVVYVVFKPETDMPLPLLLFAFIGFTASIVNMFGDLFESYIKRKVNIKDMGNIMPGHGGVMDRIDGMLFTAVYVLCAVLVIWG